MENMKEELKNLSSRINYILSITGTKKADLARAIGVKPQVIQFLCNSETQSSRFTFEIATALGLNTRWLATGEGQMFLVDESSREFSKMYSRIPLLDFGGVRDVFLYRKSLEEIETNTWLPLKTDSQSIFAIKMPDTSMEPYLPFNADLFISESEDIIQRGAKFVFAYMHKFDTFIIRELVKNGDSTILAPKNAEIFKEIYVDKDISIFGVVTGCSWQIRSC